MNKSRSLGILTIVAALAAYGALIGQTVLAQDARPGPQAAADTQSGAKPQSGLAPQSGVAPRPGVTPQSGVAPQYRELPNFHQVNDHLYRGAQPGKSGMKRLAELGIKTIVNLRGEADLSRKEEAEAKAAGLRYFSVPMPGLSRPVDHQVALVMAIIDSQENWPVFVHCQHGADRTGTIVACYHISHDGWTADRSIAEAKRYGMSWVEFGMRSYISAYHPAADRKKLDEKPAGVQTSGVAAQGSGAGKP